MPDDSKTNPTGTPDVQWLHALHQGDGPLVHGPTMEAPFTGLVLYCKSLSGYTEAGNLVEMEAPPDGYIPVRVLGETVIPDDET